VPDEAAVFTEPLAAALRIPEQVVIDPADRVLVLGDGRLGQLAARVLRRTGCALAVAGRHGGKLALLEALGVEVVASEGLAPASFDVVVECTGSASGFDVARRAVRPLGTLVLKSTYAGRLDVDASALVVDEITVLGSRCGPFEPALRLLAAGAVDPTPLIHARLPLRDGVAAFAKAAAPGVLKVLLDVP
jgi:threonine dehydrogenase-like Zn-dependent dehydrogenase